MSRLWERLRRRPELVTVCLEPPPPAAPDASPGVPVAEREVEPVMEPLSRPLPDSLTCPSCKVTVPVTGARVRQICQYCGNFYNAEANTNVALRRPQNGGVSLPLIAQVGRGPTAISAALLSHLGVNLSPLAMASVIYTPALPPIPTTPPRTSSSRLSTANSIRSSRSIESLLSSSTGSQSLRRPVYPVHQKRREEFLTDVQKARESDNYADISVYLRTIFESFADICAAFKEDPERDGANVDSPELKMEFLYAVHDALQSMPSIVQKSVLKSIINSLLQEKRRLFHKDEVRALFILVQSPLFAPQSSYTVFAHLLRQLTTLSNGDHQILMRWFRCLEAKRLKMIVSHIIQFITIRQFPPADASLPPLNKSRWWIPTAIKVLALINAANNAASPALISYTEFYNHALDHVDLMQEYANWQTPDRPDRFSYCQYPFILSIVAKRTILTKDSEQQMILTARRSLVAKVSRHQPPQIDVFFLNIHVRRSRLLEDSLKEIANKQRDLKKKLKVTFSGEPGLDMGGLTKEWFMLIIRKVFDSSYGMFVYHNKSRCYWFSTTHSGSLREYNLIGVLMGLAVYNGIILDLRFPHICYKKLLSPPVVPTMEHVAVGIAKHPTLEDLAQIMPEVARGLKELLAYEGNVEEDLCLNFHVSIEEFGKVITVNLRENGEEVPVTNENRDEYVRLYLDWILNTAIYEQVRAFYLGFHTLGASNALLMFRPEEVEMVVCGCPTINLSELKKVTEYDGYTPNHEVIQNLWATLEEFSTEDKKRFLLFVTGSDRVPVGGMGEMTFKVSLYPNKEEMLPLAHTCFNQLVLPAYRDRATLKQKLSVAICNAEGFGLE
ncbi:probable E3 ubiquitin-protein ligase HECTD2 isoform X1 [Amphibalanus amphitrite]|uniref:probable E3 ubiquitin-protein ligase HECTD2 isoform X1 n=1 Tax=Amphibalanus amphitrite TaxID=1232801 RepID=UPI001C908518|nr:probable E3 ubiquitin-protein ligase HECTD2 isoform X1 [Amphibalanus amphitrite]